MLTAQEEREFIRKHLTATPPIPCEFKTGELVTFTNPQGVSFEDRRIIGFSEPDQYGRFIHLSGDTPYWYALAPDVLIKQKGE